MRVLEAVRAAFHEHRPSVFGFVHAETSTGTLQPHVPDLTAIAHEHGALVIADTVTSLGGVELRVDEWDIDVAYSGGYFSLSGLLLSLLVIVIPAVSRLCRTARRGSGAA